MRSQLGSAQNPEFLEALLRGFDAGLICFVRARLYSYSMVNDDRWLLFTRNVDRGETSRIKR